MVLVLALPRLSLVLFPCHSFDLFFREFISSLPVPVPSNFCFASSVSFYSLPIPAPDNICLITCLLISSLPEPFPDNSVLLVWICLVSTHACLRLRLLPAPLVPQPLDSRYRPHVCSLDLLLDYLDCYCLPTKDSGLLLFSGQVFL